MKSSTFVEIGDMRYLVIAEWTQLPKSMPALPIAGVSCAPDGCIYAISRNHEHPIVAFDPDGRYIETIGRNLCFLSEHGISFAPDGNLWVCDSGRHVVYKLTRKGEVIRQLGQIDVPCDNGFDPRIPYPHNLYTIAQTGKPFNLPTGAMETDEGSVYCTDGYANTAVHHFNRDGQWLSTFGSPGSAPGQFRLPHALWIDIDCRIWVADRDNYRVQLFSPDGELLHCFDPVYPKGSPYGPSTLWGDSRYVYAGQNSVGILMYDVTALTLAGIIEAPAGSPILGHSLCGDRQGNLYIGHLDPLPMISKLERIK